DRLRARGVQRLVRGLRLPVYGSSCPALARPTACARQLGLTSATVLRKRRKLQRVISKTSTIISAIGNWLWPLTTLGRATLIAQSRAQALEAIGKFSRT